MRIAVLISGRGSNMLRLVAHAGPASGFEIVLVAANKVCKGLALAETQGLSTQLVSRKDFSSRQDHETALGDAIVEAGAEIICLAGYMAILAETLTRLEDLVPKPDLVLYDAGVDVHQLDALGHLQLTNAGIAARDRLVIDSCLGRDIPVCAVIGGGYDRDRDALARRHGILHHSAAAIWQQRGLG